VVAALEVRHGSPGQRTEHAVDGQVRQRQQLIQTMLDGRNERPLVSNLQNGPETGTVAAVWVRGNVPRAGLGACRRDRGR
jgi:hypothetical protein